jgi:flagellar protein FliL
MKKTQLFAILLAVAVVTALAGAGAVWWVLQPAAGVSAGPVIDKREYKYVSLDKVIAMLRGREGGPLTNYIAVDLVFKTPVESEPAVKNQLPMLRSVAVKALSGYTLDQATMLSIEELSAALNQAFEDSYAAEARVKPFTVAMIGKLIIE